jgi:hypothetical protein
MAIISIPSSIGGVAIPGLTNVPGGPLGVLFGNPNQLAVHQYPRDLGSATKGHSIKFEINEITPVKYDVEGVNIKLGDQNEESTRSFFDKVGTFTSNVKDFLGNTLENGASESFNAILSNRKTYMVATVALYMPDTMNFQYSSDYSGHNSLTNVMAKVGSSLLSANTNKMLSTVATPDVTRLALATQGLALNPQEQVLFNGIDFRTYTLAFTFTPYSREESREVKNIIKLFRQYAAPRLQKGTGGMFFIPPGTFNLKFLFNGQVNKNITQVGESVITSIDVNYAPNGWSTHSDGAPVQTTLTMSFKEIQLVDRTQIEKGY